MSTTDLRTKKAPKREDRRPQKEKTTIKVRYGVRVQVSELRIGDEIVTVWEGDKYERRVAKSVNIDEIDLCGSQWRTHIHVNKRDCYDTRGYVYIVEKI